MLCAWIAFAVFGDHNVYVAYPDGTKIVKDYSSTSGRVFGGFVLALPFALIDTALIWGCQRMRRLRPESKPDVFMHE